MLPCDLVQAAHTEFMSMKTHRVLNGSTKCVNVRYRKIQFHNLFTIKTKKIQHTILKTYREKFATKVNKVSWWTLLFENSRNFHGSFFIKTII